MFNKNRVQKYALRSSGAILIIRDFDSRPNKCGKAGRTVYGSFLWTDTQKSTTSFPPYKDKYDTKECLRRQASTAIAYNLNAHLLTFCPSFNLFVCGLPTERLLATPQSCVSFARRRMPFY